MLKSMKARLAGALVLAAAFVGTASAQFVASFDLDPLVTQTQGDISNVFTTLLPVMIAATALIVAWKYARRLGRGL